MLGGRYRVDEQVGHGGTATVWRGCDLRLQRPVAIKILDPARFADGATRQRFWREAQAVAALPHPHIVAVYDVALEADAAYVVMELIDGPSVSAVLQDGPLPRAQAVDVALQTCAALAAAHAAGMVHRDITPANLLLSTSGLVKVCDFGIAAWQEAAYPSLVAGTRGYTAPEQAAGGPVDPRTDLFGLGCTLYAMLTGAPPPAGRGAVGELSGVREDLARLGVPAPLAGVVARLTAPDPGDRPSDADHAAELLAAARPTGPAAAPPPDTAAPLPGAVPPGARGEHGTIRERVPAPPVGVAAVPPPAARVTSARSAPQRPDHWLRPVVWATTGVLAIVAGLFFIVYALGAPAPPTAHPAEPPATAAVTPAAAPPSPSRPGDQLDVLRREVDRLARTGDLSPKDAADLRKKFHDVEKRLGKDTDAAADKAEDLRARLDDLRADGRLSAPAYRTLAPLATRLAATLT